jgi:hypothetical protein
MCNNLIDIYQNQFNVEMLSSVLRLATAASPTNTELVYLRFMVGPGAGGGGASAFACRAQAALPQQQPPASPSR